MNKKFVSVFFIFIILLTSGFKKYSKPQAILSSTNIVTSDIKQDEISFRAGQRIFYTLISPSGFKYSSIRIQVLKQDDKTSNWGFSLVQSHDFYIDKSTTFYKDYIYITQPGHYILQFFYSNNKDYPFIHREIYLY